LILQEELIVNLHMHTVYSDGCGLHKDIAEAALQAGVDVVIVTDHNVLVNEAEKYYQRGNQRVLMLIGEEIHDRTLSPQKNHLLVIGAGRELAALGAKTQRLVDQVQKEGGVCFIAHPNDPHLALLEEEAISWEAWDVNGFTGIELWNAMSEMKKVVQSRVDGLFYAYFPHYIARGPDPQTIKKWDELTGRGQKVVAVGGSDAHAFEMSMGPIRRVLFPYAFHFQTINTHVLVERPLSSDLYTDRQMIINALKKGHAFVGYDLPAPTRGFRFNAQARDGAAIMGDDVRLGSGVTLQVRLPRKAECRLLCSGEPVRTWQNSEFCTHIAAKPGAYRVECTIDYMGQRRGWIYSNPIYVRE
jgi:hypothetical protein